MDVYEAIKQMRALSVANKSFSFAFMSYSKKRDKSHGMVEVQHGRLRKQSTVDQVEDADIMLNYFNLDTSEFGQLYQPLLMEFNGIKLELN